MNNKVRDEGTIVYTNSGGSTIAAGTLIDLGQRVGIAVEDIAVGASKTVVTKGIFSLPKDTNLVISQDDRVYLDTVNSWVDKTAEDQQYVGVATSAAAQTATTVEVEINAPVLDVQNLS